MSSRPDDAEIDKILRETSNLWNSLSESGLIEKSKIRSPLKLPHSTRSANGRDTNLRPPLSTRSEGGRRMANLSKLEISGISGHSTFNTRELNGVPFSPTTTEHHKRSISTPERLTFGSLGLTRNLDSTRLNQTKRTLEHETVADIDFSKTKDFDGVPDVTLGLSVEELEGARKAPEASLAEINFSAPAWREVNCLLARMGFDMVADPGRSTQTKLQDVACKSFIQVLTAFESLKTDKVRSDERIVTLETQLKNTATSATDTAKIQELRRTNQTLEEELGYTRRRLAERQLESDTRKETADRRLRDVQEQARNTQRLLTKAKVELDARDRTIEDLKVKLAQTVQNSENMEQNAKSMFKLLRSRNPKSGNNRDKDMLDLLRQVDNEREKTAAEISSLRTQIMQLAAGRRISSPGPTSRRQRADVAFTASKAGSDVGDFVDSWKVSPMKEFGKVENASNSRLYDERRMHSTEMKRATDRMSILQRRCQGLEEDLRQCKVEKSALKEEYKSSMSREEASRLRLKMADLTKQLKETRTVADLRKYMDTRELIKRDRDIHALQLAKVEALPKAVSLQILQDVCINLSLNDATQIVPAVKKLCKLTKAMPRITRFLQKITSVLVYSEHASELAALHKTAPDRLFERVIPTLQRWIHALDELANLKAFRQNITQHLARRTLNAKKFSPADVIELPLHDMIRMIRELVASEEYSLKTKESFDQARESLEQNPSTIEAKFIQHFMHLFSVKTLEGIFPALNTLYRQVNESRNLIKTSKSILGLEESTPVNKCFEELQNLVAQKDQFRFSRSYGLEKSAGNWNRISAELQEVLQCDEDSIIDRVRESFERCVSYDDVFPRVHDLVRSLRSTLGVQHTHEILPKVQELLGV